MSQHTQPILVVDLDETFLQTDLVWEAITQLVQKKPYLLPLIPLMLLRGRVRFKYWLDRHVTFDINALPRTIAVEHFLRNAKAEGRTVVLATASLRQWVEPWALQLGYFDRVFGTDTVNLRGSAKLDCIRTEFEGHPFDYIGNSAADIPLWRAARSALIVGNPDRYERRIGKRFAQVFTVNRPTVADWLQQLRIEQWSKNLLVLLPIVLAHKLGDISTVGIATIAAALMSILASALYTFNDIVDLERDRRHLTKRNRPLARGIIPLRQAWIATIVGVVLSFCGALLVLSPAAVNLLLVYAVTSVAYSTALKHIPLVDVIVLGGLYMLRIVLGGVATETEISTWLLGFAFVFFTSLALLKRHSETVHAPTADYHLNRPYDKRDEPFLLASGIATGGMAVVILILYLTSDRVRTLYTHPERLWAVLPLVLLWLLRMWRLSVHGKLAGDPLGAALHDRVSIAIAVAIVIVVSIVAR
ncbi:MAG: UbiA family prenyltransferase [Chlorobi bacterium]|nr:UbiA family prenyltransferase [Chlorobiota bacterium]